MLLDKFEVGKRYKFTKEKFIERRKSELDLTLEINKITSGWVDEIDQKEVLVQNEVFGHIEDYIVNPSWCEEIITEPLRTRDDIKDMYEQLLELEELEKLLDGIDEYMPSGRLKSKFLEYTNSEIERVMDELGLEK